MVVYADRLELETEILNRIYELDDSSEDIPKPGGEPVSGDCVPVPHPVKFNETEKTPLRTD